MRKTSGAVLALLLVRGVAIGGPPFKTDDPEPVEYLHWEFYIASVQEFARSATSATLPHVEVNYGAVPDVQLHIIAPFGYARTSGGTNYGFSDVELGVKFRFVQETEASPQVGVFPLLEVPTGDQDRQLGTGNLQAFLPVWIQKSWGKLSTYGGGGVWYVPAAEKKTWLFTGWQVQYEFSSLIALGTELYAQTADSPGGAPGGGFSVGGFLNLDEQDHILFSVGHSIGGGDVMSGYIGYQLTI